MSTDKAQEFVFDFDPDFSHLHPNSIEAARERGYVFDEKEYCYRDPEGRAVLDQFGQPLG